MIYKNLCQLIKTFLTINMNVKINVTRGFIAIICNEKKCQYAKQCANHTSAGNFRTDDGMTPELSLKDGEVYCNTILDNTAADTINYIGATTWIDLIQQNKIMDNLIIPNPTKYEITYTDSKNKTTTRKIVVIGQESDSVTAYCYHSHGVRTFKKAQISKITSVS